VRSIHHPNECEPKAGTAQIKDDQQIPETLGCPGTWAPITWFTVALVVVGGLQGILFWWQLGLIRDGAADTAKAADAALLAGQSAAASVDLATKDFITTHRLRLRVHNVSVDDFGAKVVDTDIYGQHVYKPGESLKGTLLVTNIGDSRARINGSYAMVFIGGDILPMRPPIMGSWATSFFPKAISTLGQP
jgi:hypothetical protein